MARRLLFLAALALGACQHGAALSQPAMCATPRADLLAWKASEFAMPDAPARNAFALTIAECVGDPDPAIRDGVVYEGLAHLLRADALTAETKRALAARLLPLLQAPDARGFQAPFAALVLSEVARADRLSAFWTPQERAAAVAGAVAYVGAVRDYRGFDEVEGWRHGVAHGADLLMQLALNPAVDEASVRAILGAVESQVAPPGHFYIYGESERLARVVLMAARRDLISEAEWSAWFARVSGPGPLAEWEAAFRSQAGLARRHDVMAFLSVVYLNARLGGAEYAALLPGAEAGLRGLP